MPLDFVSCRTFCSLNAVKSSVIYNYYGDPLGTRLFRRKRHSFCINEVVFLRNRALCTNLVLFRRNREVFHRNREVFRRNRALFCRNAHLFRRNLDRFRRNKKLANARAFTALFNHQYCYNLLTRLSNNDNNNEQACSINIAFSCFNNREQPLLLHQC